ncbi:radical SAM protein [Desulfosporosinus hippei]|uniref:Radical SAM superfamily enzyme, MoaA/NifB/PqqE/SkfB family n=1 Tax=Desulfosporosinus hippei DSM 8344 TaxID=1121419 RepID=A0A1G8H2D8_9FIRM|nr:radical SAM protein [Desulfosporosinus hippei]SDI00680.1 Radical SAM superfamily enzyme, MoaA/NifB/PqqE/SkfB family [Desulfosporosinus hippei DSM 8344]
MAQTLDRLYSQLVSAAKVKRELLSASFELTSRCNLQCKMCYVCQNANDREGMAKELTTEQWISLAQEAQDLGLLFLTLTGGEVFMRKDFREIYQRLMMMGFILTIYTNGTLITPEIVNWLAAMPPYKVSITLYGASGETYKEVTGFADGYARTVRAIDSLLENKIPTDIKTTVVQGNKHDYDKLLDFAQQRKLDLGVVNYVSPRREGTNTDPIGNRLTPQELLDYEVHINERNMELGLLKRKDFSSSKESPRFFESGLAGTRVSRETSEAFHCLAGKTAAWITADGRLLPCGLLDGVKAFPLSKGLAAAWEELKQECDGISPCKECQGCLFQAYCEHCPARLLKETGQYTKNAPYLCELARKRKEAVNWDVI